MYYQVSKTLALPIIRGQSFTLPTTVDPYRFKSQGLHTLIARNDPNSVFQSPRDFTVVVEGQGVPTIYWNSASALLAGQLDVSLAVVDSVVDGNEVVFQLLGELGGPGLNAQIFTGDWVGPIPAGDYLLIADGSLGTAGVVTLERLSQDGSSAVAVPASTPTIGTPLAISFAGKAFIRAKLASATTFSNLWLQLARKAG